MDHGIVDGGFLQSEYWEKFQISLGRKIVKVDVDGNFALMIEYQLPIVGSYFFVPRGPILKNQNTKTKDSGDEDAFLKKIIEVAIDEKKGWIRIEPQSDQDLNVIRQKIAGKQKIVKAAKNHEPAQTLMLDLIQTEEEILSKMKSKTRYNIRLAQKKDVQVFCSRKQEDVERFCDLVQVTAQRDGIVSHPRSYYQKMIEAISEDVLGLYIAKIGEHVIAANLVCFYGGVATYLHGASANEYRNAMAPYLLQWKAIMDAKKRGYEKYDLGGTRIYMTDKIMNTKNTNSWAGITKFKQGFCPDEKPTEFPGCFDIVINQAQYLCYRMIQKIKGVI